MIDNPTAKPPAQVLVIGDDALAIHLARVLHVDSVGVDAVVLLERSDEHLPLPALPPKRTPQPKEALIDPIGVRRRYGRAQLCERCFLKKTGCNDIVRGLTCRERNR
jgi:hypothetical protein